MERLASFRKAAGLSQRDLAKAVAIGQPDLHRIERGEHAPGWSLALRLAAACGVTLDTLRGIDGPTTDLGHIEGPPLPKLAAQREWSLRDLSREAKVPRSGLARVAEGRGTVDSLAQLAAALDVSLDALGRAILRSVGQQAFDPSSGQETCKKPALTPETVQACLAAAPLAEPSTPAQPATLITFASLRTLADCAREHGVTRQRMGQVVKELQTNGFLNVQSVGRIKLVSPSELRAALEARRMRKTPLADDGWTTYETLACEMGVVPSRVRQLVNEARKAGALSTTKRGLHVMVPEQAFRDYMAQRTAIRKERQASPPQQPPALPPDEDEQYDPDHIEAMDAAAIEDWEGDPDDDSVLWDDLPTRSIVEAHR